MFVLKNNLDDYATLYNDTTDEFKEDLTNNNFSIYGASQLVDIQNEFDLFYNNIKEKSVEYELENILKDIKCKVNNKLEHFVKVKGLIDNVDLDINSVYTFGEYSNSYDSYGMHYITEFDSEVLREVVNKLNNLGYKSSLENDDMVCADVIYIYVKYTVTEEDIKMYLKDKETKEVNLDVANNLLGTIMNVLSEKIMRFQKNKDLYNYDIDKKMSLVGKGFQGEFKNSFETYFRQSEYNYSDLELDYLSDSLGNLGYSVNIRNEYDKELFNQYGGYDEDVISYVTISW